MSAETTCIHELDVVSLRRPADGYGPADEPTRVEAGARGTVVRESPGSAWVEVEFLDERGDPRAFVEIERSGLRLEHRLRASVA